MKKIKKKILKNKIRIPAYTDGLTPDGKDAGTSEDTNTSEDTGTSETEDPGSGKGVGLGKGVRLNAGQMGAIAQGVGMLAESVFGTSTATNDKEVAMQTASGIMKGALAGAAFGPWGMAAGAAIGSIGQKGEKAKATTFTDYDEGTLGTGIIGAFGNRGLKREQRRIKQNAYTNRAAVAGTANLNADYAKENTIQDTSSFAEGGVVPTSLAYVDDGELIQTPDGRTLEVPEKGRPADSVLVDLPVGSKILSDKLKVPGTNKTFAQVGKEMITNRKSKFNDKYAENAHKLNEANNQMIYDELIEALKLVQLKSKMKPKTKQLNINDIQAVKDGGIIVPAYEGGVKDFYSLSPEELRKVIESDPAYKLQRWIENKIKGLPTVEKDYSAKPVAPQLVSEKYYNSDLYDANAESIPGYGLQKAIESYFYNAIDMPTIYGASVPTNRSKDEGSNENNVNENTLTENHISSSISPEFRNMVLGRTKKPIIGDYRSFGGFGLFNGYGPGISYAAETTPAKTASSATTSVSTPAKTKTVATPESKTNKSVIPEVGGTRGALRDYYLNEYDIADSLPELKILSANLTTPLKPIKFTPAKPKEKEKRNYDWIGDVAGTLGQLAAAIPGLTTKAESEDAVYNPYANAAREYARRRSSDISADIDDARKQRAISNYNIAQVNTNTGAGLPAMVQSAINANRHMSNLRMQQRNANNQYLLDQANLENDLGKQFVAATNLAREKNAANKAAAQMARDVARKDIRNIVYGSTRSQNAKLRDKQLLPLYRRFLKAGFTDADLAPIFEQV